MFFILSVYTMLILYWVQASYFLLIISMEEKYPPFLLNTWFGSAFCVFCPLQSTGDWRCSSNCMRCGLACGSLALLDLANTISVNHYLLLYIMQCLLVGIEIIHEKTPACSSTHTPSRKAYNATVGRNRLMTHYSCLDELRIQKKTFPIGKSNKLEAGREKNKGSEWQDYALVSASYTHNRLFWTVWKKKKKKKLYWK